MNSMSIDRGSVATRRKQSRDKSREDVVPQAQANACETHPLCSHPHVRPLSHGAIKSKVQIKKTIGGITTVDLQYLPRATSLHKKKRKEKRVKKIIPRQLPLAPAPSCTLQCWTIPKKKFKKLQRSPTRPLPPHLYVRFSMTTRPPVIHS